MRQRYLELIKTASRLTANDRGLPVIRIAILGDHSTQQLTNVLRGILLEKGVWAEVYEADFDNFRAEILDPESGLHQFAPDYTWLCLCSQQYKRRFLHTSAGEQIALPGQWAAEVCDLIRILAERGSQVVVNNLVTPRERFFGNFSVRTLASAHASVQEVNRQLLAASGSLPQCYVNDVAFLAARVGLDQWYDDRLWVHSKYPCAPACFVPIAQSAADIILATRGRITKCVVLDLDNTLWGGVIGDDGLDRIEIGGFGAGEAFEDFQRYLLQLKQRGIILAVCSKNDEANARLPFREHPGMVLKEEDIAAFVANWEPKSENLRRISRTLNLGLDSFVFIDDSAFERNEVRMALPEVQVPEMPEDVADYASSIEAGGYFETTTFTDDDRRRADMYREEFARADLRERVTNIDDYLRSLEMKMRWSPLDPVSVQRVAQLIQRSNQFNLRTQRFSEAKCREFMDDSRQFPSFHFSLRDKFGDYGLIAAVCCEVAGDRLEIREWVMSCRVLNRGVEERVLNCIAHIGRGHGFKAIGGEYLPTPKNKMVSGLYSRLGFQSDEQNGSEGTRWTLSLENYSEPTTYIDLLS